MPQVVEVFFAEKTSTALIGKLVGQIVTLVAFVTFAAIATILTFPAGDTEIIPKAKRRGTITNKSISFRDKLVHNSRKCTDVPIVSS